MPNFVVVVVACFNYSRIKLCQWNGIKVDDRRPLLQCCYSKQCAKQTQLCFYWLFLTQKKKRKQIREGIILKAETCCSDAFDSGDSAFELFICTRFMPFQLDRFPKDRFVVHKTRFSLLTLRVWYVSYVWPTLMIEKKSSCSYYPFSLWIKGR